MTNTILTFDKWYCDGSDDSVTYGLWLIGTRRRVKFTAEELLDRLVSAQLLYHDNVYMFLDRTGIVVIGLDKIMFGSDEIPK